MPGGPCIKYEVSGHGKRAWHTTVKGAFSPRHGPRPGPTPPNRRLTVIPRLWTPLGQPGTRRAVTQRRHLGERQCLPVLKAQNCDSACGTDRWEPLHKPLWLSHFFHCTHGCNSHSPGGAGRAPSRSWVQEGLTMLCSHELCCWDGNLPFGLNPPLRSQPAPDAAPATTSKPDYSHLQ